MSDKYESASSMGDTILVMCQVLAEYRSKDPKTKVGACVYDRSTEGMHFGYNGFPSNIWDKKSIWDETDKYINKHDVVIHAETNAILKAMKAGARLGHSVLFCTLPPCADCAKFIVSVNIDKVVIIHSHHELSIKAREIFKMSHVSVRRYSLDNDLIITPSRS